MKRLLPFALLGFSISAQALTWQAAEDQLFATNKELQSLQYQVKAQELRKKGSQLNLWLPEVDVKAGYGDDNTVSDQYQGYVGFLEGRWSLYAGGGQSAQARFQSLEKDILDISLERKKKTLRRELAEVFYNLWVQDESLKLWKERQDLLKEQRVMARKKINAGLSSEVDGLEIDLEENVAEAEVEGFKHARERLIADLQKLLPEIKTENLTVAWQDLPQRPTLSPESAENLIQKSSWVRQSQLFSEQAQSLRQEARAGLLPHLELGARYGRLTPQYGNPTDGREHQVSLLLTWNIFSGTKNFYSLRASSSQVLERQSLEQNEGLRVASEIVSLRSQILEKEHLRGLLQKREKAAKSYYNLTLSEYRRGIKNSSDLASATRGVFDTKQKLIVLETEIAVLSYKMDELI